MTFVPNNSQLALCFPVIICNYIQNNVDIPRESRYNLYILELKKKEWKFFISKVNKVIGGDVYALA